MKKEKNVMLIIKCNENVRINTGLNMYTFKNGYKII